LSPNLNLIRTESPDCS